MGFNTFVAQPFSVTNTTKKASFWGFLLPLRMLNLLIYSFLAVRTRLELATNIKQFQKAGFKEGYFLL